jgi:hypothetical protein
MYTHLVFFCEGLLKRVFKIASITLGFRVFVVKRRNTTVKLDGRLVEEVAGELGPGETLTGYVRKAVRSSLNRARMGRAAEAYEAAIRIDPDLAAEMEEWEGAELGRPPRGGDVKK